jgi:hypothetical protein
MKTKRFTRTGVINNHQNQSIGTLRLRHRWIACVKFPVILLATLFTLAGTSVRASDPTGVFAKIDKVVLEPNDSSPERIQLWGAFCVADPKDRDSYLAPQKGYLYYRLPTEKSDVARKEWNDFKAAAGSGDVIGFGSRQVAHPKVRSAQDKPENPDVYSLGYGLVKAQNRSTSYPPIKALLAEGKKTSPEAK